MDVELRQPGGGPPASGSPGDARGAGPPQPAADRDHTPRWRGHRCRPAARCRRHRLRARRWARAGWVRRVDRMEQPGPRRAGEHRSCAFEDWRPRAQEPPEQAWSDRVPRLSPAGASQSPDRRWQPQGEEPRPQLVGPHRLREWASPEDWDEPLQSALSAAVSLWQAVAAVCCARDRSLRSPATRQSGVRSPLWPADLGRRTRLSRPSSPPERRFAPAAIRIGRAGQSAEEAMAQAANRAPRCCVPPRTPARFHSPTPALRKAGPAVFPSSLRSG